jgi:hypothetical protein
LPSDNYIISDEPFDPYTSNPEYIYPTEREGVYHKMYRSWWGYVATREGYIALVDEGKRELDEIFGAENVTAFVWPYCRQDDAELLEYIKNAGYKSIRRTGSAGFEIPGDRYNWCYNAIHSNILERAREYEQYLSDDLSFFCFGVHSHDFENNNCWDVLENFAEKYGNRPEDFWYANVRDIFDYEDAVKAATVTDTEIVNNSEKTLYAVVNGKRVTLFPHDVYKFN